MKAQKVKEQQPESFGAYRVEGKAMAQGGMATVYKVRSSAGKVFAAKVLNPDLYRDKRKRDRFRSEYEILSRMRSKRIIKPVDWVEGRSLLCMVLEYVDGMELSQIIGLKSEFPEEAVLHILMEISLAFRECHRRQLYHRDLKPENVLVSRKGAVKLIDFGVVRDMDVKRTLAGTVLGTVDYMAPEQIEGSWDEVDQRADLYGLGVLAYEMLARKLPIRFSGKDSIIEVLNKKKKRKPPLGKIKSPVLHEFCTILMSPDQENRPKAIDEVLEFIRRYKKPEELKRGYQNWLETLPFPEAPGTKKPAKSPPRAKKIKAPAKKPKSQPKNLNASWIFFLIRLLVFLVSVAAVLVIWLGKSWGF